MTHVPAEDRYDRMVYRRSGRSGLLLPAISLGLWWNFGGVDPFDRNRAVVRRAFDVGITHFDLANNYGRPAVRVRGGDVRTPAPRGSRPLPRRARHLDEGRLRHVAGPVRRVGLAQVPTCEPRPEPRADGPRLCRHLLLAPLRPGDAARGDDGRARLVSCAGKALYVGISSYSAEQTREAARILRALGTPLLINQPSYSMLNRWIEPDLLDALGELGVGCIVFSPLAQGMLTDKYLDGIPEGSRASRPSSLSSE